MNYKDGYLKMFTKLTTCIELLEKMDMEKESVNLPQLLKEIQATGEEACIAESK